MTNSELQSWDDLADLDNYEKQNNLLLIDGNNMAYRWMNRRNYNSFGTDYVDTVKSLGKSYKAARIIVAFDFGKSYYRLEELPTYKANRTKPSDPEKARQYDEFFECLNETIDNLPIEYYKFRGVEADDIIAFFVEETKEYYDHIWVISSDKDLYQLVSDNVSIFNLYGRKEITEDYLLETHGVTPDEYLLAKIIQGDKGDNIDGIEGIGEKRGLALARDYQTLDNLIKALPINKTSKYIKNLNSGISILTLNEKLIGLKKYYEKAIKAGKFGDEFWNTLITNVQESETNV